MEQVKVLIAYGSKNGSTAGLARMIGDALETRDILTDVCPANIDMPADRYDAVIVAGALYANRWHRDARRFVRRNADGLRNLSVWLVSSGPLDDTARAGELKPVPKVAKLASMIDARGCVTFGGRLAADATGFASKAMAKTRAGDWRNPDQVADFAARVATELGKTEALRL